MQHCRKIRFIYLMVVIMFILASFFGCNKEVVNVGTMTPDEQFVYAKTKFDKKDYTKAKMHFLLVVMNNPGNIIIEKAQFYLAESYFYLKEYILAVEEYEKLIRSLPQSPFVDNARYKIGFCYYKLSPGYTLDQEYTYKAISQFQYFLEEFPDSELKPEVERLLVECRNKLAKKRFKTGELYRKMGYYKAAIISFDALIETFYDTEFADDSLFWKGKCHYKMGQLSEAEKSFEDLISKYKQSKWINKAEKELEDIKKKKEKVT